MTNEQLESLVRRAWQQANGHGLEAIKLLRDWTNLGLRDAAKAFECAGLVEVPEMTRDQMN
jgi:ribosomal protein L7/L12